MIFGFSWNLQCLTSMRLPSVADEWLFLHSFFLVSTAPYCLIPISLIYMACLAPVRCFCLWYLMQIKMWWEGKFNAGRLAENIVSWPLQRVHEPSGKFWLMDMSLKLWLSVGTTVWFEQALMSPEGASFVLGDHQWSM